MLDIKKIITKCSKEELRARFLLGDYCPIKKDWDTCTIWLLKLSEKSDIRISVFKDPDSLYFIYMLDKNGIEHNEVYNIYEYYTDYIYQEPILITIEDFEYLYNKLS